MIQWSMSLSSLLLLTLTDGFHRSQCRPQVVDSLLICRLYSHLHTQCPCHSPSSAKLSPYGPSYHWRLILSYNIHPAHYHNRYSSHRYNLKFTYKHPPILTRQYLCRLLTWMPLRWHASAGAGNSLARRRQMACHRSGPLSAARRHSPSPLTPAAGAAMVSMSHSCPRPPRRPLLPSHPLPVPALRLCHDSACLSRRGARHRR